MHKNYSIVFLLFFCIKLQAQKNNPFYIYYDPPRYTDSLQQILVKQKNFKTYTIMVQAFIDPQNKGEVDKKTFINNINKFYPDSLTSAILCLDLENKAYDNLRSYNKKNKFFKNAAAIFIWMVKTVKTMRPNVKVGIYGLPLRFYYSQSKEADSQKFDKILSACDFIFPSLYTAYPDSEVGNEKNKKYLTENLTAALAYGVRLKKPVIPFMWNAVHPSNKKHGGELLTAEEMYNNILFIKNFKYKNIGVQGIIWWDPDYVWFGKYVKLPADLRSEKSTIDIQSELFYKYTKPFITEN